MCLLFAKIADEQNHSQKDKPSFRRKQSAEGTKKKVANHETKSRVKGPKPKEPHLVLPPGLGSEDHHAIYLRQLQSRISCPC